MNQEGKYNVTKDDIIFILNEVVKNDIQFWELDDNYLKEGLTGEQQKEWSEECINKAVEIINKFESI